MDPQTERFLQLLHRGGQWRYLFTLPDKRTYPYAGNTLPRVRDSQQNVYFGVHPLIRKPSYKGRGTNDAIAAINCVYADIDDKHFGNDGLTAWEHIMQLALPPSVIIDSGGGWHLYWLLDRTFRLQTPADRARARNLQANCVKWAGGDQGAKDLARILRLPGTRNLKPEYAPDFPVIGFVKTDFGLTYRIEELEACAPPVAPAAGGVPPTTEAVPPSSRTSGTSTSGRYAAAALKHECRNVAIAPSGQRNHQLNKAAFNLGQLVGAGLLSGSQVEDDLWAAACQAGLDTDPNCGRSGIEKTIRSGLEAGIRRPRDVTRQGTTVRNVSSPTAGSCPVASSPVGRATLPDAPWSGDDETPPPADSPVRHGADMQPTYQAPQVPTGNDGRGGAPPSAYGGKVTSDALIATLHDLGYEFQLNECDNSLEVNGYRMDDVISATIRSKLRDLSLGKYLAAAEDAIWAHAGTRTYHPVRAFFQKLTWDGQPHIARITDYVSDKYGVFGLYIRSWLIGAVARAYTGSQNAMLVLDGGQGIGKSQLARWLCPIPGFFVDRAIDPDVKDADLLAIRSFVWEVSELGATTRRTDVEALKSFITREIVTVRQPYGHYEIRKPALANFIGTVNNASGLFSDPTGNRRFLTTTVTKVDWAYRDSIDIQQVWAEAHAAYTSGEDWRLTPVQAAAAARINQEYEIEDPVENLLRKFFRIEPQDDKLWTSTADILGQLQGYGLQGGTKANQMALSATLKRLGLEKKQERGQRGYLGIALCPIP